MKEVHTTDNQLHDLITPTCEEQGDRHGMTRPQDEEKPYGGWEGHWAGDGSGTGLGFQILMIIIRTRVGTIKVEPITESQLLPIVAWDLAHASERRAMKREYEDWLREQDRLSDDKYGIVCARDIDWE